MFRPFPHLLRLALTVLALLGAGPACAAFAGNGDGTVSDTATGLIWDQCSWGQSGSACAGSASTHNWAAALSVAASANASAYKGHNDWRLPNRAELEALVKIDVHSPAIENTVFPGTTTNRYWSSTIYTPNLANAWGVSFDNGDTTAGARSDTLNVR